MTEKKQTSLSGVLMYPLSIGTCAWILYGGQYIRTSPVVAVHSVGAQEIRFETRNTLYRLLPKSTPQAAGTRLIFAA